LSYLDLTFDEEDFVAPPKVASSGAPRISKIKAARKDSPKAPASNKEKKPLKEKAAKKDPFEELEEFKKTHPRGYPLKHDPEFAHFLPEELLPFLDVEEIEKRKEERRKAVKASQHKYRCTLTRLQTAVIKAERADGCFRHPCFDHYSNAKLRKNYFAPVRAPLTEEQIRQI
jgi:hypothetical protein